VEGSAGGTQGGQGGWETRGLARGRGTAAHTCRGTQQESGWGGPSPGREEASRCIVWCWHARGPRSCRCLSQPTTCGQGDGLERRVVMDFTCLRL
jgi:hypothetical protein